MTTALDRSSLRAVAHVVGDGRYHWVGDGFRVEWQADRGMQPTAVTLADWAGEFRIDDPQRGVGFAAITIDGKRYRADLAKKHLQTLLDANLDRAGLVDLAARFDSRYFARLASRPELAPEARRLADAVLSAVQEQTRSAEHVGQMIEWLSSDNQRIRDEGIIGLRKAGSAAVVPKC